MSKTTSGIKKFRDKIRHLTIGHLSYEHQHLESELQDIKLAIGKHEARTIKASTFSSIQDAEFKVFSQFGEDGIIQYLVNKVPIKNKIFIELGTGDYSESNTRFLLMNDNWKGRIVNSGTEHLEYIKSEKLGDFYYRYDIEGTSDFITKENVNIIIKNFKLLEDIGILSIDLDGVDYWVWEAVTNLIPRIVIIEYNSSLGNDFAITVPYKSDFEREKTHYSHIFFGASLKAQCYLAKKKGYQFVGSNSAGNNAFFVRNDLAGDLPKLTAKEGYVQSLYRDSKGPSGEFTYVSNHEERRKLFANEKVFDVEKGNVTTIGKLYQGK